MVSTPLKNMSSSTGMMTFPTEWEKKSHVPVTTNQIYMGKPPFPMVFLWLSIVLMVHTCQTRHERLPSQRPSSPRDRKGPNANARLGRFSAENGGLFFRGTTLVGGSSHLVSYKWIEPTLIHLQLGI